MTLKGILGTIPDVEPCRNVTAASYAPPIAGLGEILSWQNGFYAYGRGLHLFGACSSPTFHSLQAWNEPGGWIGYYGDLARGLFFFAEDSFGDQFAWDGRRIVRFLAETGGREDFASSVGEWLERIVRNPQEELGLVVLEEWVGAHGKVPEGLHLFPRTPLVTGGSLDPAEIVTIDPFENMRFKGHLATQIADVPDGEQIELIAGPPPEKKTS